MQLSWLRRLSTRFFYLLAAVAFLPGLELHLPQQIITPADPQPSVGTPVFYDLPIFLPTFVGCGGQTASMINAQYEQRILELVNDERAAVNLPPLKRVGQLDEAARYHAADLQQDNYFEHDTYDRTGGSLQLICNWSTRLSSYYTGWSAIGENIAAGYASPEAAMVGWMNSPGHRANILSTSFWEIGVGYSEGGGAYYRYYVQDFGKRSASYPLVINQDDASTTDQTVLLYIYGTWSQMRLRNNTESWSGWLPFGNSTSWQLPPTSGNHTVSIELTKPGSSASSSDTIYLDLPTQPVLGNLPDVITFTYSIADQFLWPASALLAPQNVGNGGTLNWQLNTDKTWLEVNPVSGITPDSFTISPVGFITDTVTTLSGTVTVTITSPPGVTGSPHAIFVHLSVINSSIWRSYLPLLSNDLP